MTGYVLDTDTCIYWLNGNQTIRGKVGQHAAGLNITMITYAELRFGAYNSQKVRENLENIDFFLKGVSVLPLTRQAADKFGQIKTELRKKGDMIGDFDILIAAVTIDYESTLVTRRRMEEDSGSDGGRQGTHIEGDRQKGVSAGLRIRCSSDCDNRSWKNKTGVAHYQRF